MSSRFSRRPKDTSPKEVRQDQPTSGAVLPLAQALADHLNGNIEGALARLSSSEAEEGSLIDVVAARAHLLMQANRFEEAQKQFARLISMEPSLESAHFHSGFCSYQMGRFEDALAGFIESSRLAPHRADTQVAMGNCLLNLNRPTESFVIFDECLTTHPDDEGALLGKAVGPAYGGIPESCARRPARIDPQNSDAGLTRRNVRGLMIRAAQARSAGRHCNKLAIVDGGYHLTYPRGCSQRAMEPIEILRE